MAVLEDTTIVGKGEFKGSALREGVLGGEAKEVIFGVGDRGVGDGRG